MPTKECDWPLVDLLMRHGARVPDWTKWGARHHFQFPKKRGLGSGAYSGRCRPLIPADGGHRFRLKKPTCSGGPDQEISG